MRLHCLASTFLLLACHSEEDPYDPRPRPGSDAGNPRRDAAAGDDAGADAPDAGADAPDAMADHPDAMPIKPDAMGPGIPGPVVQLEGTPQQGSVTRSIAAFFTFTSEPGATFECRFLDAPFTPCTSPRILGYAGPDGVYSWSVRAINVAGVVGPETVRSWTLDLTPPTVTLTGIPANGASTNQPVAFTFQSEAGATFECSRDGGPFLACTSPQSYDYVTGGGQDGAKQFRVRARDAVGNVGQPALRSFVWDTVGPRITDVSGGPTEGGIINHFFLLTLAATETATFECRWDNGPTHTCANPEPSPFFTGDAAHVFTARAFDALGNPGPLHTHPFHYDDVPPDTVIQTAPADACPQTAGVQLIGPARFTFSSNDPTATFSCLFGRDTIPCASPLDLTPADGDHSVSIRAVDRAGNTDATPFNTAWTSVAACP
jgi:large repetitive protein